MTVDPLLVAAYDDAAAVARINADVATMAADVAHNAYNAALAAARVAADLATMAAMAADAAHEGRSPLDPPPTADIDKLARLLHAVRIADDVAKEEE